MAINICILLLALPAGISCQTGSVIVPLRLNIEHTTGYQDNNTHKTQDSRLNTSTDELHYTPSNDTLSWIDYMGYVSVPVLLVVGLTGNTLTIIVMRTKSFKAFALSYILIALAISDITLNIMLPFNKMFLRHLLGVDIRTLSEESCKIFYWLFRSAKMTSSWLVVLVSFERFMSIVFPFNSDTIVNKKSILICISIIYVLIGGFNGYWCSFGDNIKEIKPNVKVCIPTAGKPGMETKSFWFLICGVTLYAFFPSLINATLTTITCVTLIKARRLRRKMSTSNCATKNPTAKTTAMLISIGIAFMILVLPIGCAHITAKFQQTTIPETKEPSLVYLREIYQLMEHINYSINFFLYTLCCASFRKRVFSVCTGGSLNSSSGDTPMASTTLRKNSAASIGGIRNNQIRRVKDCDVVQLKDFTLLENVDNGHTSYGSCIVDGNDHEQNPSTAEVTFIDPRAV